MMKLGWLLGFVCLGLWITTAPAHAELILDSQQISLATTQHASVGKSLRLTTDTDITNLVLTPSDLEREGGAARIPAAEVKVTGFTTPLVANQAIKLDIEIDGGVLKTSGAFTGTLLVQYDGSSQLIPISVQVKAEAWKAWIVVVLGVGIGTVLSIYQATGLPRDELLVRVSELRERMRSETAPQAERFKTYAESRLLAVETGLRNRQWKGAEASLVEGQTVWDRWHGYKQDWIQQIEYLNTLTENQGIAGAYAQTVKSQLNAIAAQLATYETPQALAEQLTPVREQISRYQQGKGWLDKLFDLFDELDENAQSQGWERKQEFLEDELKALDPKDTEAFREWLTRAKTAYTELAAAVAAQGGAESEGEGDRSSADGRVTILVGPVPTVGASGAFSWASTPQRNLALFRWATPLLTIGVIAWVGMAELYEKEATFGAAPISDYLGLFAWGFGAEVSRDALVKVLGDLRTPLRQKKEDDE